MRPILLHLSVCLCLIATYVPAQTSDGPIAIVSTGETDAAIANRLREIIAELGGYTDVTVVVSDGIVTFRGTTDTVAQAQELTSLANRLQDVVSVRNEVTETTEIVRRLDPTWDRLLDRVDQFIIKLPLVLIAAAAFAVIIVLGLALARMKRPWDNIAPNSFIADIYRQLIRMTFFVLGLVLALDILNATALLSTILGAAGIIGLAIGFAVRDTVENFIASVLLSFRQPFRPNDAVEIGGDQGKVIRLTSRATILLSFDGNHIRIPNSTVFKSKIVNFSKNKERRFKFDLLIDRDTDLGTVRELITNTVSDLPFVLKSPATSVWIERLEPAGAVFTVAGWVDQHETSLLLAQSEAIRMAKKALHEHEIGLVDATQVIAMSHDAIPENEASTPPPESQDIATVDTAAEEALDDIIQAELDAEHPENLLHQSAQTE